MRSAVSLALADFGGTGLIKTAIISSSAISKRVYTNGSTRRLRILQFFLKMKDRIARKHDRSGQLGAGSSSAELSSSVGAVPLFQLSALYPSSLGHQIYFFLVLFQELNT